MAGRQIIRPCQTIEWIGGHFICKTGPITRSGKGCYVNGEMAATWQHPVGNENYETRKFIGGSDRFDER